MADPIDFHDLTAIDNTLKYIYGQGITNQFADEKVTYNQFPISERKPRGLGYQFSIRYARAQSTGARGESQKLPDPLVGKFDKGLIYPKYIYGSLRLTGPMIEAAKSDVAAFVDGLSDSVDDIYQSIVVDLNRMAWNDGFGKIGTLSAVSDTLSTSADWTVTMDNDVGVRYAKPGMLVDFFESGAIDESSVASRINTIDATASTMEMEKNEGTYKTNHPSSTFAAYSIAAATVASGAVMVKMGSRQAASWTTASTAYEMMGLEGIYDDDTLLASFEDIDTGTYPMWRANVLGNSSVNRELSIDLMLQAVDLTRMMAGAGQKPTMMRMGLGQRRKYANLLMPDVRFAPTVLKGGYETLTFAGGDGTVQIVIDPMAQPNKIYFEPGGTIQKYEMFPLGWGDMDGAFKQRAGYDEYDRFLKLYTNLGTEQRNNLTVVKDLVEPNLYS